MPPLLDAFLQRCPKCGRRSLRLVLSKKLADENTIDGTRTVYGRSRLWSWEEGSHVTVYSYEYTRKCRVCGHAWTEVVTKQRPW